MNVKNNQVYFNIKDNKVSVKSRAPINLEDLIQIISSGIVGALQQVVNSAPEEQQAEVKGYVYDLYNVAAARTLEIFAPEFDKNPTLTADAILKAENEIIQTEYDKVMADPTYKSKYTT